MYEKDNVNNPSQLDINTESVSMLGTNPNEAFNNQSTSDINADKSRNDSHLYGVELINDLKINEARKLSQSRKSIDYSRRSTPFSQVPNLNFDRDTPFEDETIRGDSPLDPLLDRATPRRIKKRIKQIKIKSQLIEQENTERALESRNLRNNYDKHEPRLDGFELQGSNIRVESQTTVRPLANMNYKNAEDKAKVKFELKKKLCN